MLRFRSFPLFSLLLALLVLAPALGASAADSPRYRRSVENYQVPDVILTNQNREKVRLVELLDSDIPVMVDFIYGTCTTICPVLSAGFSNLQKKLSPDAKQKVRLVSVTIDPEYDTPEIMTEYLKRYRAQEGWDFLTGTREDIDRVMHAFNAYIPDKMGHYPLNLLKGPGKDQWVRIYGLLSTRDLMSEYDQLLEK
ncbi:photosynthetic protein synthase I [Desulfuromonas versatilis]|uniref:Photosynthetic protein synthase I n=1 Tax=Desulfuromonas versatilis TaxID=2802975 RepID=A0ABM8HUF8_9BACT|nr:SCO family protein [Desulfuromonas versatilis]BCR06565.1 photosynthetic protein synthase I [Desulfuromonas versatilis]